MESHPLLGDLQASVHPCQHATVMKRIMMPDKGLATDGLVLVTSG